MDPDGRGLGVAPASDALEVSVVRDDAAEDRDRSASHRDEAASDRDAAAARRSETKSGRLNSRADREASAGDRLSAEQDRLFAALDREFAEFDRRESGRERADHTGGDAAGWSEAGRRRDLAAVLRDEAATRRDELAVHRMSLALTRDREAALRDRRADMSDALSDLRDRAALERDRAAAARDVAAIHRDLLALERERHARELTADVASTRIGLLVAEAETDRQLASVDRLQSAIDRLAAMQDRVVRQAVPTMLGVDPETGVHSPGDGLWALEREIEAAESVHTQLAGAIVDLAPVLGGSTRGIAALVDRLRASLAHRDLVVRWSGTELLVILVGDGDLSTFRSEVAALGVEHLSIVRRGDGEGVQEFVTAVIGAGAEPALL